MQHLDILGLIVLVGIAAIVIAATAASLSPQAVIASSDSESNSRNVTLGSLLAVAQGIDETYHAINDSYATVSYLDSVTLLPPNADTTINATESGNSTVHFLPNGITLVQGQGFLVTQEDGNGREEENATSNFVSVGITNPNGTESRTGVVGTGGRTGIVYYTTNSTGKLAFLDNRVGIYQAETSQERVTSRMWEWKGE